MEICLTASLILAVAMFLTGTIQLTFLIIGQINSKSKNR